MRAIRGSCISAIFIASILLVCILWTAPLCQLALGQDATGTTSTAPQPLITQPVDESQLTTLTGNTYPLAKPQYDLGTAPASLPMERMLLVLKRSPEQEFALRKLLDDQQDKTSPNYHKWLTPEEVGQQFGPTDADMQTITAWLQSRGFQVGSTKGRTVLEFSGSASQVQEAFHTTIHKYLVNGEQHWANASDPQIPTALTPAVAGILTLHNFLKKPQYVVDKDKGIITGGEHPQTTFSDGSHGLAPGDFGVIYNVNPVYSAGINGSGITIGVVARSQILFSDFTDFLNLLHLTGTVNTPQVVVNGPDPGDELNGDDFEGTLDMTWSQAIAPQATVDYVVSASTDTTDGVDLSETYIIENNLANVMTESFGSCEAAATDAQLVGTALLAEQAAAQGITYLVSSGDEGAEGCDNPNRETVATGPISVNHLASTPFTVAVGGTVFNEHGQNSTYWSASNTTNGVSALSYIPEDVWNDSCPASSCGSPNIVAAGGGESLGNAGYNGTLAGYPKPSWQANVTGIPNQNARYLPDVSLTAALHDGYLLCYQGSCAGSRVYRVGGTSASAPSFAGIMALVDQKMGQVIGANEARQGQADYVLYPLAAAGNSNLSKCNGSSTTTAPANTCTFNDITVGNNEVPGEPGYPSAPYNSTVGYDPTSGLGSVDVNNLVSNWANSTFRATTTNLSLSPTTNITHGQAVNVTVGVTASTGTPTGDVSLIVSNSSNISGQNGVDGFTLTSGGTFTGTTMQLPGGSYNVWAHYAGIYTTAFFAASDSNQVSVTVKPEGSTTTLTATTFDPSSGNLVQFAAGSNVPYGDMIYLHAFIAGLSGNGVPTGTVSFFDNASPMSGSPYALASDGSTTTPFGLFNVPAGSTSITSTYSSDASFTGSSSAPLDFTITLAQTNVSVTPSSTSISSGQPVTLTANLTLGTAIIPSFGNAPTGTVAFFSGTTSLGNAAVSGTNGSGNIQSGTFTPATGTASLTTNSLPTGQDSITAVYNGDFNYAVSPASPGVVVTVSGPDFSLSAPQVTVTQGNSQTATVTVNAIGNFTGVVGSFACTAGLPAETTCGFNPTTVTGSGSTTLTITTTPLGQSGQFRRRAASENRGAGWMATSLFSLLGVCLIGIPAWGRRRRALPVLMMVALLMLLPSCGGGSGGGGGPPPNPVPSITSLSPTQQAAGSQSQTLTINGSNFMSSSTATYNGTPHAVTFTSASQISIALTTADMAATGSFPVVVTNPAPGGGASSAASFNVVTGTPVGTFSVMVTATSGTAPNQLQHSTTFNLVVQ